MTTLMTSVRASMRVCACELDAAALAGAHLHSDAACCRPRVSRGRSSGVTVSVMRSSLTAGRLPGRARGGSSDIPAADAREAVWSLRAEQASKRASEQASKQASEQGSVSNRVVDDEHRLAIAASCCASSPPLDGIQGSRHAHSPGTRTCAERARTLAVMPANITSVLMPANIRPARTALCSRQAVINMGFGWERPKPWRRGGGCVPWRLRRRASSPAKGLLPHLRTPDGGVVT